MINPYSDAIFESLIAHVDHIFTDSYARLLVPALDRCEYTEPESVYGSGDGGEQCTAKAIVFHLDSDQELCLKHFRLALAEQQLSEAHCNQA